MNDEISKITEERQEYQEYVESFAHEIKIPIGALSLTFDNTKNHALDVYKRQGCINAIILALPKEMVWDWQLQRNLSTHIKGQLLQIVF